MNTEISELLDKCSADAFAGKMTFLETLQHMAAVGVRWYSANLASGEKTAYLKNGESHTTRWPDWKPIPPCPAFTEAGVVAALRAIQRREIIYPQFLQQIVNAGVTVYTVHLHGRKAIYLGADGDFYVEPFPKP
jgi:uncharacterized protein YbcV (DUF1398 family)